MMMLRQLRKDRKLSMKELGNVVGVAESTISQYETGKREPDFETLLKLGEFFDVSIDYLLRGNVFEGQEKVASPIGSDLSKDGIRIAEKASLLSEEDRQKVLEYISLLELKDRQ